MNAKRKIEIGKVYSAKVGGTYLPVRIVKSLGHGRYQAASMPSGSKVKISTSAIKDGDGQTIEQWTAAHAPSPGNPPSDAEMAAAKKPAGKKKDKKPRSPSGLDAAAQVLREAGEPLNTKAMVERMLEKGLWKTGGKTPAATIYSAILREITVKGDASRFRKTDRGLFELTAAGQASEAKEA